MEVDMSVVFCVRIESNVSKDLHSDDGVDEKEHSDQQNDVRQSLEGLDEGPQKNANGVALPQKLDQTGGTKQPQEANIDKILLQEKKLKIITEPQYRQK